MLNEARLRAAAKTFRALFFQAVEQDTSLWRELLALLSMEVTSTGDSENYNWLGAPPKMTEWIGDRVLQRLRAAGTEIKNKKWANGIEVQSETIDDDKLGLVRPRIVSMSEAYWLNRWEQVLYQLNYGASVVKSYNYDTDSQYFFDTQHSEGDSGEQANVTTNLLDADSYAAARAAMQNLKNDRGVKMGISPTHLLVCPTLEGMGRELLMCERNPAGATNKWYKTAELVVVPGLDAGDFTADKAWMLLDARKAIKPVIDQVRKQVVFSALEKPDDQNVFMRSTYNYGADYRGNAGPALWQLVYASLGSGT
jgi:phage major head subunit gpT-like protein